MKIKVLKHHRVRIKASNLKALDDTTTISPPTDDTYVNEFSTSSNYGEGTALIIRDRSGFILRIFIRFDLSSLSGATINLAKVRLYYYEFGSNDPSGRQVDIHRVLGSWDESTITWDNKPSIASTPTSSINMPSSYGWVEWDVTTDVQDMVDGTVSNYGWCIKFNDETKDLETESIARFYSKEYDGYDPELYVEYTAATYITVSDTGTGTDYVETQAHLTIGDSGSGADAPALKASIPVSDSGVGSETVLSPQMIEVVDSGSGVDNVPAMILGAISDSGSGVEAIGLEASLKVGDSGAGSEYVETGPPTTYVTDSGIGVDEVMVAKEQKRIKPVKRVRPAKRVREARRVEETRGR